MHELNESHEGAHATGAGRGATLPMGSSPWHGRHVDGRDRRRWSYEEAGRAFTTAALAGLPVLILAAVFLSHGTVAGAPWAHAVGLALIASVVVAQYLVRRSVRAAMEAHHLEAGLPVDEARRRARSTLDAWTS